MFERYTRLRQPQIFCLSIKRRLLFSLQHCKITYKFRNLRSCRFTFLLLFREITMYADYSLYVLRGLLTLTLLSHVLFWWEFKMGFSQYMVKLVRCTSVIMLSSLNIIHSSSSTLNRHQSFVFKIGFYDLNNVWPVMCWYCRHWLIILSLIMTYSIIWGLLILFLSFVAMIYHCAFSSVSYYKKLVFVPYVSCFGSSK